MRRGRSVIAIIAAIIAPVIAVGGIASSAIRMPAPVYSPTVAAPPEFAGVQRPNEPALYMEAYVTGYNTVRNQTDDTPCIAASGANICGRRERWRVRACWSSAQSSKSTAGSMSAPTAWLRGSGAVSTSTATRIGAAPTRSPAGQRSESFSNSGRRIARLLRYPRSGSSLSAPDRSGMLPVHAAAPAAARRLTKRLTERLAKTPAESHIRGWRQSSARGRAERMDIGSGGTRSNGDRARPQASPGSSRARLPGLPVPLPQFFATAAVPCPYVPGRAERKLIVELAGTRRPRLLRRAVARRLSAQPSFRLPSGLPRLHRLRAGAHRRRALRPDPLDAAGAQRQCRASPAQLLAPRATVEQFGCSSPISTRATATATWPR